ncbi:hypothetical protein Syun_006619 [Stephania yunnanensis]|uniref:Uncharacterized protein n=1 Tax=Stephania yunnanensis TaxID=152371 RepID=A0AAP0KYD7_9MAGN
MSIIPWTCHGAKSPNFKSSFKEIVRINNPDLVAILEQRISGVQADQVVKSLGFTNWWMCRVM